MVPMAGTILERTPATLTPRDQIRIVYQREKGLVEAYVPTQLVYREDVPVDKSHVLDLVERITEEARLNATSGQLSPVLVGELPGFPQFPIIDGFHRVAALTELQRAEIYATVRTCQTWEEVWDRRIGAATSHRAVRFARLIEWVDQAWRFSPWADRLKVTQAFQLRFAQGMTGSRLGLTVVEAIEIREWVDKKGRQWGISPAYIHQQLTTAQVADPALVKEARERKSGHILDAITPHHLSAIARTLPLRFELQRLVAEVAKREALTVDMSRAVAEAIRGAKNISEANHIINSRRWGESYILKPFDVKHITPDVVGNQRFTSHIEALKQSGYAQTTPGAQEVISSSLQYLKNIPRTRQKREATLLLEGDPIGRLLLIEEGYAMIYNSTLSGSRRILDIEGPMSILGSELFHGAREYEHSAEAFTDCSVQVVHKRDLVSFMQRDPRLAHYFVVDHAIKMARWNRRIQTWTSMSAPQRVAGILLDIIDRNRKGELPHLNLFTHQVVGDLTAMYRESATSIIDGFQEAEIVKWIRGLGPQFVDENALRRIYRGEE